MIDRRGFIGRILAAMPVLSVFSRRKPTMPETTTTGHQIVLRNGHFVRLVGSHKDVEKWTVSYTDPKTGKTVVRRGEMI